MSTPASDRSLLRRFQNGDARAASALYGRYAKRLRGLARGRNVAALAPRVDADDVVQSTFRSFFRGAREGAYEAPEGGELWQLLAAITVHKLRYAREHHLAGKRDLRTTAGGDLADELAVDATADQDLQWVMDDLFVSRTASEREIVELRVAGHLVAEIAERTGRAKRSVERVLQEFRDDLYRALS